MRRETVLSTVPKAAKSSVHRSFNSLVDGFVGDFDEEAVAHFQAHGATVERETYAWKFDAPWGLDRLDQATGLDGRFQTPLTGDNSTIYILDVGVRVTHSEFAGRISLGKDFVDEDDDASDDCDPHGTHVAGTAAGTQYGVAKGATIVPVRVLNCEGIGPTTGIIAALEWVSQQPDLHKVVSLSLGQSRSALLDSAVAELVSLGTSVVAAAGNDSDDACKFSPAGMGGSGGPVITVGAMTIADQAAFFTNAGDCVDIFAPGQAVVSAWMGGDDSSGTISGTSMATPHVTGVVALMLSFNAAAGRSTTPADIKSELLDLAVEGVLGPSPDVAGRNVPNRVLQIPFAHFPPPAPPSPPSPPMPPSLPPRPPSPPSPPSGRMLSIQVIPDNNPEQTAWKLYRDLGTNSFVEVQSAQLSANDRGVQQWQVELQPGAYRLDVLDSNYDGLCCSNGYGSFRLDIGDQVIEGAEFRELAIVTFSFDSVPSPFSPPSPAPPPLPPPPPSPAELCGWDSCQLYVVVSSAAAVGVIILGTVLRSFLFPPKKLASTRAAPTTLGTVREPGGVPVKAFAVAPPDTPASSPRFSAASRFRSER